MEGGGGKGKAEIQSRQKACIDRTTELIELMQEHPKPAEVKELLAGIMALDFKLKQFDKFLDTFNAPAFKYHDQMLVCYVNVLTKLDEMLPTFRELRDSKKKRRVMRLFKSVNLRKKFDNTHAALQQFSRELLELHLKEMQLAESAKAAERNGGQADSKNKRVTVPIQVAQSAMATPTRQQDLKAPMRPGTTIGVGRGTDVGGPRKGSVPPDLPSGSKAASNPELTKFNTARPNLQSPPKAGQEPAVKAPPRPTGGTSPQATDPKQQPQSTQPQPPTKPQPQPGSATSTSSKPQAGGDAPKTTTTTTGL